MRLFRHWIWGAVLVACLSATTACSKDVPVTTKEEVSVAISKELSVGSSAADIENFFKRHNIDFGWDKFGGVYNGVIREVEPFHGISIVIFVDKERRFVKAEVRDSYTAP